MGELSRDNFLVCKNSQGEEFRAVALRMSRHEVAFEVYNPYSIIQLSEVLQDCKIYVNGRMVYSGRAVVRHLINTGVVLVCDATLVDDWLDVDLFASFQGEGRLAGEFQEFLENWKKNEQVIPEFKLMVADMETLLSDLHRWLDQVEMGIRSDPSSDMESTVRSVIHEIQEPMLTACRPLFERFETVCSSIDPSTQPVHAAYVKRHLHPLILCSPFVYRIFSKPLGYAGDYEMVNMMLRDPAEGSSLFAKMVNIHFLNFAPAVAHRNRIDYLVQTLENEVERHAKRCKKVRILNLGCGPAGEVQRFLRDSNQCEEAEFTLLDFNDETLAYTQETLDKVKTAHGRNTSIQFIQRSVHQILKQRTHTVSDASYDLIYCAGLFDYLSDRVCKRLVKTFYELLSPDGLVVVTNVDPSNPDRSSMEYISDWFLNYRNKADFEKVVPKEVLPEQFSIKADKTGVNIFLEIRK